MGRLFFYSLFSNKSRPSFPTYFLLSIFINFSVLFLFFFSFQSQIKTDKKKKKNRNILVNLEILQQTLKQSNSELINNKNQKGSGKLSNKKEQHIVGKQSLIQNPSKKKKKKWKKKKGKDSEKTPVSADNFAIETKNQLENSFYVDDNDNLKLSIRSDENANFLKDLKRVLSKQFNQFMEANFSSIFNYKVKQDEVVVLASINRKGEIFFVDALLKSKEQPYLNYLIKKLVSSPDLLKVLPTELQKNKDKEYIQMILKLRTTGQPLYQWWISIDFDS